MQLRDALKKLLESNEYREWHDKNPNHYLAHGFYMDGDEVVGEWQIGFYNKDDNRITTFALGEQITVNPPSELFQKESGVKELIAEAFESDSDEALDIANEHRKANFKGHEPTKTMILLQHLAAGQVWNITFITNKFAVCNVKVDAKTLEVISSSCESLMGWGHAEKGERKK